MNVVSQIDLSPGVNLRDINRLLHLRLGVVMLLLGVLPEEFARNELLREKLPQPRGVRLSGGLYCSIQLKLRDRPAIAYRHDSCGQVSRSRLCRHVRGGTETNRARSVEGP